MLTAVDVKVPPLFTVDATEFTSACFHTELRKLLTRQKYYSLKSLYKVLFFGM
jgi:hypothetical protein